jgi:TonB family protein
MTTRRVFWKVATAATIFSLALTPDVAAACSFYAPLGPSSSHMRQKCRAALAKTEKFLAKVKADRVEKRMLQDYVLAFDVGQYGCTKNGEFVFRILDSFYSVPERKLSEPYLLQRYVSNWPENLRTAERKYATNLVWLFADTSYGLPPDWTPNQSRAFVEKTEHWKIAVAKFGKMEQRDEAVFASVSDPQSQHFDREMAVRLTWLSAENQRQRRIVAASLFTDPRFGPTDFAKAETLLPISAQFNDLRSNPTREQARALWGQIADGYAQSSDPALREKGLKLRERMAQPVFDKWPIVARPDDGRIWLSLADWPKSIKNPFDSAKYGQPLISDLDYPARAHRNEEEGDVSVAARFGPDGKFSDLEVIQSSGHASLDEAAMKLIVRRFFPRLRKMALDGYIGSEVRVPLLVVSWRISQDSNDINNYEGMSYYTNDSLFVIAAPKMEVMIERRGCNSPVFL